MALEATRQKLILKAKSKLLYLRNSHDCRRPEKMSAYAFFSSMIFSPLSGVPTVNPKVMLFLKVFLLQKVTKRREIEVSTYAS